MSTGIELIPIALAIGAAVAARRRDRGSLRFHGGRTAGGADEAEVQTFTSRMRDPELLRAAIEAAGGCVFGERDGLLFGALDETALVFAPDPEGAYDVYVGAEVPFAQGRDLVEAIDRSYGVRVQQRTRTRVHERATDLGFAVESEYVDEDDSIVVTLLVGQGGR